MTFWELFLRLLPWRPWAALAALYWHLTRRRVRARNRLLAAVAPLPFAYDVWVAKVERGRELESDQRAAIDQWRWRPSFTVVLHGTNEIGDDAILTSESSLDQQVYPNWTVEIAQPDSIRTCIDAAKADYVVLLRAGDVLSPTALFHYAETLQSNPDAVILYGDEDEIDGRGRRSRPWFKPRWNEELFLAQDYLSRGVAIRAEVARRAGSSDRIQPLLLSAVSIADASIVHVPHIIVHAMRPVEQETSDRLSDVGEHLELRGATCVPGAHQTIRVEWPLPEQLPLVSIIIPTKDKIDLLEPCVSSILSRTRYNHYEILIVDNASIEARTAEYLSKIAQNPKVRVLDYPGKYNFSAINNFAAKAAGGDYLCLLNNDTEVVEPEWLTEMIRYAVRGEIGAVGAKLLYEDGSIQHAGVAIGIGEAAGHSHRNLPDSEPGYFQLAHVAHYVSAVTAACLVVETDKFMAVGGLDEKHFAVAFNDVDFCLKLQAAGWRNVYVPHAVLLHHESKSRGSDFAAPQVARYRAELKTLQERWNTRTCRDPLHNPNLDRYSETFVLRL